MQFIRTYEDIIPPRENSVNAKSRGLRHRNERAMAKAAAFCPEYSIEARAHDGIDVFKKPQATRVAGVKTVDDEALVDGP